NSVHSTPRADRSRSGTPKMRSISETALEIAGWDNARCSEALAMLPTSATVCNVCRSLSLKRRPMRSSHSICYSRWLWCYSKIRFLFIAWLEECDDEKERLPSTRGEHMPRHASYLPKGVIPAVLLPFNEDFLIDERSFRQHLRDVASTEGLSALTINAHSTEVSSCTFDEQRRVLEIARSEEHTSELQSRGHLVCRLLLEKKKMRPFSKRSTTSESRITSSSSTN